MSVNLTDTLVQFQNRGVAILKNNHEKKYLNERIVDIINLLNNRSIRFDVSEELTNRIKKFEDSEIQNDFFAAIALIYVQIDDNITKEEFYNNLVISKINKNVASINGFIDDLNLEQKEIYNTSVKKEFLVEESQLKLLKKDHLDIFLQATDKFYSALSKLRILGCNVIDKHGRVFHERGISEFEKENVIDEFNCAFKLREKLDDVFLKRIC